MKNIFVVVALLIISVFKGFSQSAPVDTVAYKIGYYEVKKKQTVAEVAQKLKVEPAVLLRLNRLRNLQLDLNNGQRIKIPLYANGYKYEPKAAAKPEPKAVTKPAPAPKDTTSKAAKQPEEKKKPADKKAVKTPVVVKQEPIKWNIRPNYDPELDENNLMLLDATLELNEAMLAGIKASLDTLEKPDPEIKNGNDVKEILQRMKRVRDRKELIPYLQYMKDSLSMDCAKIKNQRDDIQSRLLPYYEYKKADSINSLNKQNEVATAVASSQTKPAKKKDKEQVAVKPIVKDTVAVAKKEEGRNAKTEAKEKPKEVKSNAPRDTVIVYEVNKPAKGNKEKATAKADSAVVVEKPKANRISDTVIVSDVQKPKPAKKDTIASVKKGKPAEPKADTLVAHSVKKTKEQVKDTATVAKKAEKVTTKKAESDFVVIRDDKPKTTTKVDTLAKKAKLVDTKTDTTTKLVAVKEPAQKKDTVVAEAKAPVTKTPEKKTAADYSNFDTIQNIKSQFLVKRAQKAIAEKKDKLAEEYLTKATELWKDNYEAWMTWADMDARTGAPVKALAEYQECVRIDSSRPVLFYKIASLYLQSKKKTDALRYFSRTIEVDQNYILAYMGRASILSDYKQYDAAVADYDKVLSVNKNYHYAYKSRGMVKQLNRDFSDAVKDFTQYINYEETDPSAYYYRGLAKIGNNQLLEGCLDLSKSAEMGYEAAEKAIKKSCE